jgi:hypothetical protein
MGPRKKIVQKSKTCETIKRECVKIRNRRRQKYILVDVHKVCVHGTLRQETINKCPHKQYSFSLSIYLSLSLSLSFSRLKRMYFSVHFIFWVIFYFEKNVQIIFWLSVRKKYIVEDLNRISNSVI